MDMTGCLTNGIFSQPQHPSLQSDLDGIRNHVYGGGQGTTHPGLGFTQLPSHKVVRLPQVFGLTVLSKGFFPHFLTQGNTGPFLIFRYLVKKMFYETQKSEFLFGLNEGMR